MIFVTTVTTGTGVPFFCKISSYFGPKFGYLRIYELFGVILLLQA